MPKRFVRRAEYGQIVFMSLNRVETTYPIVDDTAHTARRQAARTSHATMDSGWRISKIARTKRLGGRYATSMPPAMPTKYASGESGLARYSSFNLWSILMHAASC